MYIVKTLFYLTGEPVEPIILEMLFLLSNLLFHCGYVQNNLKIKIRLQLSRFSSNQIESSASWVINFCEKFFLQGSARTHYLKKFENSSYDELIQIKNSLSKTVILPQERINILVHGDESTSYWNFNQKQLFEFSNVSEFSYSKLQELEKYKYDSIVLFETISNIPNPDDRISLLSSLRNLLNSPGINGYPHRSGLLFLLESQSNFLDYDGKSVSRELLNLWRQLIRSCGYELVKQRTIELQNFPAIQAFVFATSSNATGDTGLSKNKMSSQLSPLKKLYVSRDYIIPSNSNVDNSEKITKETSKKKSAYKYKSSDAIIGIIGGGLGGTALGLALQQKGIPFKIFEKDSSFTSRKQGYALTIQQGATTLKSLGLLEKISSVGQLSLGHISLDHKGKILGAYDVKGLTKTKSLLHNIILLNPDEYLSLQNKHIESNNLNLSSLKRHNIHVPRQIVREIMMKEIHPDNIKWDYKLHHFEENSDYVSLEFTDKSEYKVNVLVAADGIHSTVQKLLTSYSQSKQYQLQYLGLIVILGISPKISLCEHMNGYSRYQIQWVDGITRVFTMPYDDKHTMWQLSYPISESNAVLLAHRPDALKREALIRLKDWHSPLVQMVELTREVDISGHPTYDRDPLMLECDALNKYSRVTLLGDAAHPMSPFKGQGANQALLDVQSLSEAILSSDLVCSNGRPVSDRLREYEKEMWTRSAPKVMKSREAARYLHSPVALARADITRAAAAEALLYSANSLTGFNELTRFE